MCSLIISLILIGIALYCWRNTYKVDKESNLYRRIVLTRGQLLSVVIVGLIPAINILIFLGILVYFLMEEDSTFSMTDITGKEKGEVSPIFKEYRMKILEFLKKEVWK